MSIFTLYPRTKFLLIAISFLFFGLLTLKFGFNTPQAIKSTQGNSIGVIKDFYTGLTNPHVVETNILSVTENHVKEIVYNYYDSDENKLLPKNVNLRR